MRCEEPELRPAADRVPTTGDWAELNKDFGTNQVKT